MGYILHNAIVVTAWQEEAARALADYAAEIGAEALIGKPQINGYITVCITPDGSKEGWSNSDDGDSRRNQIVTWLGAHPGWYFEWCEVAYGSDDATAEVTRDAWSSHHPRRTGE